MMKRAIVLTVVALLALSVSASGTLVSTTLYAGQNLVAPPVVPFNPDPVSVFKDDVGNDLPIAFNLTRWDAAGQGYEQYNPFDPSKYGGVLLGDGAWLDLPSQVVWQYDGAPSGLPDAGGTRTDMWLSLPVAGATLLGHPYLETIDIRTCLMTDGTQTANLDTAMANGWFDGTVQGWDAIGQGYFTVGIQDWYPHDLVAFNGYWINTNVPNLAMIMPAI